MEAFKLKMIKERVAQLDKLEESGIPVRFAVVGMGVEIIVRGPARNEVALFLNHYFAPFQTLSPQPPPHIRIHYFVEEGELTNPAHPAWNEESHLSQVFPCDQSDRFLIHRDFVARVPAPGLEAWAWGPNIALGATDTIDNLVMSLVTGHLPRYDALALHAATIERNGEAYVFFGASGAGKSTLARLCYEADGLRVLGGDQIYLQLDGHTLIAQPCPTTVPDFPRNHPGWCPKTLPVKALIHLVQKGGWSFKKMTPLECLPFFLRETIYAPHVHGWNTELLLQIASRMVEIPHVLKAEMSYTKNQSFWVNLDREQKETSIPISLSEKRTQTLP